MINRVKKIDNWVQIKNVIASTADKTGLTRFIDDLSGVMPDLTVYSTGGTYSELKSLNKKSSRFTLKSVSDYTGQPEMQGGLVKTLDYKIYAGLLSEPGNRTHEDDLLKIGGQKIDMVIVNLYPFSNAVGKPGSNLEDGRAHIDIGGPCMLRAGAKNFLRVLPVCSPGDYTEITEELRKNGGKVSFETRYSAALKVFRHTAEYDRQIAEYLEKLGPETGLESYTTNPDGEKKDEQTDRNI